jgi:HlyD family secretion protein
VQTWLKRTIIVVVLLIAVAGLTWLAWPKPIAADLATVATGRMEVNVEDEAKTHVRKIYTVSAPLTAKLLRISQVVGDEVKAQQTVVAVFQPTTPSFHDVRSHQEMVAALAAAEAAVKLGEAEVRRIEAALDFSRSELARAERLASSESISAKNLDKAKFDVQTNEAALSSAKAQVEVRKSERASAAARLSQPEDAAAQANASCCIKVYAPVDGRVLKIVQESETVIQAGAPLIEVGNPLDLEVVAELLSTDAVRIETGAMVRIDGWGGRPVSGRVVRVDPAGFVKVSALGIEEQRVKTTIDFTDPPEAWSRLGHDYRVIVHVNVWSGDNIPQIPVSALFRKGNDWAVFTIRDGHARTTKLEIGHRNNQTAEVLSGLSTDERVVLHPSDRITEGVRVVERERR